MKEDVCPVCQHRHRDMTVWQSAKSHHRHIRYPEDV